jgi:hypothetical protein
VGDHGAQFAAGDVKVEDVGVSGSGKSENPGSVSDEDPLIDPAKQGRAAHSQGESFGAGEDGTVLGRERNDFGYRTPHVAKMPPRKAESNPFVDERISTGYGLHNPGFGARDVLSRSS